MSLEFADEVYQPTAKQLHIRPLLLGVLSAVGFLTAGLSWAAAGLAATTLFAAIEGKHLGRGPAYDGRQGQILYEMYLLTHNGRDDDFPRHDLWVNVNLSRVKAHQPEMTETEFELALAPLLGRLLNEKQDGKILSWADLVIAL